MQGSRGQSPAALVSQRLCDLFLQFPTAAIGGVRWKVLVKRYEDRHGKLDLAGLGHSSNIAAASALLWDVLRLGNEDPENPVLHVEDAATLTPQPNLSGTWPSLYASLRTAVLSSGSLDEAMGTRGLLLSQLKPLLQSHWHASFDEYGMGFFNEEGAFVKLRKMKHLVQQVLAWRSQRVAWRQARGCEATAVDEALRGEMELVASKSHNDLVLRCPEEKMDEVTPDAEEEVEELTPTSLESTPAGKADLEDMLSTCSTATPREVERQEGLERELAELRAENAALRRSNENLLRERDLREVPRLPVPMLEMDLFDDPFEPPPQRPRCWATPSTMTPGSPSASMTPISAFDLHSGAMTPVATSDGVCALVPMWFSWIPAAAAALGDRSDIPTGIVEKLRNQFESTGDPKPLQPPQAWRL